MIDRCRLPKFAMTRRRLDRLRVLLLVSLTIAMFSEGLCSAQETLESSVIDMDETQMEAATTRTDASGGDANSNAPLNGQETRHGHNEGPASLSTRLPRQHFRLKVGPTSRAASAFKLVSIRRRAALQQAGKNRARDESADNQKTQAGKREQSVPSRESPDYELNMITATNKTVPDRKGEKQLARATTRKISSAALKKLLSQTLPKLNGTISNIDASTKRQQSQSSETNEHKSPNFKFVFIQRANPKVPSKNSSSSNGSTTSASLPATASKRPPKQTLMESVSRQLGNSLFYSAANFMSHNFTSGCSPTLSSNLMPSLSSFAALVASGCGSDQSSGPSTGSEVLDGPNQLDSNQIEPSETQSSSELRRVSRPLAATTKSPTQQLAKKPKPARKSHPSRIYNLPVKFMANGQPSGVTTLHSIRQHLSTIKKLHQQMEAGSNESNKARKKLAGGQPHLKGTNSRLIYLPLKYLSNAKPHMLSSIVMGTSKMSHKKSKPATKTGTKSTKTNES